MRYFYVLLLSALLLLSACSKDNGVEPTKSGISGTITFIGEWPAEAEDVKLIMATSFPPAAISDLILGESIPVDAQSYDYTTYVDPDTFSIVGVAWRAAGTTWDLNSICALYFTGEDSLMPGKVVVDGKDTIVPDIDMTVDRSKARIVSAAKITGTVNFEGAWQPDVTSAVVVASIKDPLNESFSILDLSFSGVIQPGTQSYNYSISAMPATYKALGVIFFKAGQVFSLEDLYYSQNLGGLSLEDIVVGVDETVTGPNFDLTLGEINSAIKGTITFTGEWPDTAEEIRLITATTFPPSLDELIIGDQIPADAATYDYEFKLLPNEYSLVGVVWRAAGTNWDLISICGAYFAGEDSLAPSAVTLADANSVVTDINIGVDRSKARKVSDARIVGNITFNGTWPAEFSEARVISTTRFQLFPTDLPTMLDLSFSESIDPGISTFDYELKAFPGTFVATAVLFFKEDSLLSVNDIFYSANVGGLYLDEPIEVTEDQVSDGPDFVINF